VRVGLMAQMKINAPHKNARKRRRDGQAGRRLGPMPKGGRRPAREAKWCIVILIANHVRQAQVLQAGKSTFDMIGRRLEHPIGKADQRMKCGAGDGRIAVASSGMEERQ
jgi:hypothetical protein